MKSYHSDAARLELFTRGKRYQHAFKAQMPSENALRKAIELLKCRHIKNPDQPYELFLIVQSKANTNHVK